MSEIMTSVLRMPPESWTGDYLDVHQRHQRYLEAADEIERLRVELDAIKESEEGWRKQAERYMQHALNYQEELDKINAHDSLEMLANLDEIERLRKENDELRANNACSMKYLNEIRSIVGGIDYTDMIEIIKARGKT